MTEETSPAVELLFHVTVTVSPTLYAPSVPPAPEMEISESNTAGATASVNAGEDADESAIVVAVFVPSVTEVPAV